MFYDNPGQVNDEAINVAGGKTFQVVQLADSEGNVVDPGGSVSAPASPVRVPTTTSVAQNASSATLLDANSNRRGLSIFNDSGSTLRLSFSTPATVANSFLALTPGSFILLDQQLIVGVAIYGIWSQAGAGTAQVTEYV